MSGRHYQAAIPLLCPQCGATLPTAVADHDDHTVTTHCPNEACPTAHITVSLYGPDGPMTRREAVLRQGLNPS